MEDGSHDESWECYLPGKGHLKLKKIPPGLLEKIESKSGQFTLLDPQAEINGGSLELVDQDVEKTVKPKGNNGKGNRNLAVVTGNKTVLVVRVIGPDSTTPTFNMGNLSNYVFGTSGDQVNLKKQYAACSYNRLVFNPATHANVVNGVVEVTISQNVSGVENSNVRNAVSNSNELKAKLGNDWQSKFNHVMYCVPPGTISGTSGWIAYAYVDSWLSVYNNWCTYVSGQMHELGHNLNLGELRNMYTSLEKDLILKLAGGIAVK